MTTMDRLNLVVGITLVIAGMVTGNLVVVAFGALGALMGLVGALPPPKPKQP